MNSDQRALVSGLVIDSYSILSHTETFLERSPDKNDLAAERGWLAKRWLKYAEEFGAFVPKQQPAPQV